ncbi:DUF364 domain-containing protein [Desulfitobacterium chlororespirans]|uniref:Uncharacterized conserved protein, contains DUF4213 and DUF364 domains n=1 Tax=Desulfitobacterium chlororespirans DSM 11544 TaxID=1121395 RepID=A0A1M7TX08_9FIRM|nr:DUF364 domain-containing protein [Desulfitobacterium chlororespirans]SHN75261.1 Uncharacterized conserved protein, contains DUF4213 and DUF364 domains [Desulfitobacterium chlororespirans DSM 11544]
MEKAYLQIMDLYRQEGLKPGRLTQLGYFPKWTVVMGDNGQIGRAFHFDGEHSVYPLRDPDALLPLQRFVGKSLLALAEELLTETDIQLRAVCLAVLNALSHPLNQAEQLKKRGFEPVEFDNLEFINAEDRVVLVGYGALIKETLARCPVIDVCDMRSLSSLRTVSIGRTIEYGPPGIRFHGAAENQTLLADADIVLLSGSTLVNGTYRDLIRYARKARVIGMFGPSAQLIPEFLQGGGINYITTSGIADADRFYQVLSNPYAGEGESGTYKYTIRMF